VAPKVRERLECWFSGTPSSLTCDRDRLLVEDRRVRPASYCVSVSGPIMYRIYPYDTFLADAAVADCYSRMPARFKLNAIVWGRAVRRLMPARPEIEDANYGWPVDASAATKLAYFGIGWARRRLTGAALPPDGLATEGSWPNLAWYIRNSASLRAQWEHVPKSTRALLADAWGSDPWALRLEEWASAPNDLFRILTMATFLDLRFGA
jgi:asparagine synthase (glutamine-hydrolysing)